MRKMIRNEKGRYTGAEMDPEVKQWSERQNARAEKMIAAAAAVGMSPEIIEIQTLEDGRRWIGGRTIGILFGVGVGLAFALNKDRTYDDKIAVLNEFNSLLRG